MHRDDFTLFKCIMCQINTQEKKSALFYTSTLHIYLLRDTFDNFENKKTAEKLSSANPSHVFKNSSRNRKEKSNKIKTVS